MYMPDIILFLLLSILLCFTSAKESIPYCPNAQKPKLDSDGNVVQCLPGQREICGKGYSCYFSGFNYQCCPSDEDDEYDVSLECPAPALTVLGNDGDPIKCNSKSSPCPQKSMFCANVGTEMICCEGTTSHEDGTEKAIAKDSAEHKQLDIDCPSETFAILDHNGHTISCDDEACTMNGRFCHEKLDASMCCERRSKSTIKNEKPMKDRSEEDEHRAQNPLKYTPPSISSTSSSPSSNIHASGSILSRSNKLQKLNYLDGSAKLKQHKQSKQQPISTLDNGSIKISSAHTIDRTINRLSTSSTETSEDIAVKLLNDSSKSESPMASTSVAAESTITEDSYASSTELPSTDNVLSTPEPSLLRKSNKQHQKVEGVPLGSDIGLIPTETVQYTPHSAGGYAVSRAFSVKTAFSREDAREYARKYLLRQIRNGWPYNDRYYTPAGTNVDGTLLPNAHVVFQNE